MRETVNHTVEAGKQLDLPMTAVFAVKSNAGRAVAHALDFDLVAVGTTQEAALRKLRAAVKHHIEFGFKLKLSSNEIQRKAPAECWERMHKSGTITLGEDIMIDNQQPILTRVVINEPERHLATA